MNWNDVRYFLAVARTGSTAAGARLIGVNQTTCARRIEALETALGFRLFKRKGTGYALTKRGAFTLAEAEKAEQAMQRFMQRAQSETLPKQRVIKFSTIDVLASSVGMRTIDAFASLRPDVKVELEISSQPTDLQAGEADVALRAGQEVGEPGIISRKVLSMPWAVYCGENYQNIRALPENLMEAVKYPLASLAGKSAEIIQALHPDTDIRYSTNSMASLADAIAKGELLGAIPKFMSEAQSGLQHCFDLDISTGVWVAYAEADKDKSYIVTFVDEMVRQCEKWAAQSDYISLADLQG